jgi:arylsulfatase A-like enzyme
MFPEKLKNAPTPYSTHMVGKWHSGFYTPDYLPTSRGFDTYYGFLSGCEDHVNQANCCSPCTDELAVNTSTCTVPACQGTPTQNTTNSWHVVDLYETNGVATAQNGTNNMYGFTSNAVDKIKKHALQMEAETAVSSEAKATPFFLYAALHNTHAPFQVPTQFSSMFNYDLPLRNTWAGMVAAVDETIANITVALRATDMWDDTIFVFATDNGSPVCGWGAAGSNHPLRGSKATDWEGGVRVPAFITGGKNVFPSKLRGATTHGLVHISDWYRTFSSWGGVKDVVDHGGPSPQDGVDLSKWLLDDPVNTPSPRNEVIHDHYYRGPEGESREYDSRHDTWKVVVPRNQGKKVTSAPTPQPTPYPTPNGTGAMRVGDWKIMIGAQHQATWFGAFSPNATFNGSAVNADTACVSYPCLFNISNDPTEHHDVAQQFPDVIATLLERWAKLDHTYHPDGPGVPGPKSDRNGYCAFAKRSGDFMGPWRAKPV